MKLCDWSSFESDINKLFDGIESNKRIATPLIPLLLSDIPELHKQCAETYISHSFPSNLTLGVNPIKEVKSKIRIGYFSADLGKHAVSALAVELFELHDKNHFEIIAFSFGLNDKSAMRARTSKAFDYFIDANKLSDQEVSELAREMGIDIAVDLGGVTGYNRIGPFSYRAAPIQVNYLGYPGTSGAKYFDYIIADKTLIPPESYNYYSEKVICLPNSYQANDRKRLISDRKFSRQELNLPENSFVFACFNNNYKILPTIFASWMRILQSVEGSVLWLLQDNLLCAKNLKDMAKNHGVSEARLIFAERTSVPEHLARHRQADLFLDTFPYNAHTTASDSLWSGLPVLTLKGKSFASRVASSLLSAINLPELITSSPEEYEALAIELATNPQRLATLRQALAENRTTTPLFNTPLFTKHLESAYLKMYERYQMGLEPDHLFV
jgi:predicted O-linked N-acetylglucosamine transferase (SPINDLY family)